MRNIDCPNDITSVPEIYRQMLGSCNLSIAGYLYNLALSIHRWAFPRARFDAFPSALLKGRFHGTPYSQRLWHCGFREIETLIHILIQYPFYDAPRHALIVPIISKYEARTDKFYAYYFLRDANPTLTYQVAKCLQVIQLCKTFN